MERTPVIAALEAGVLTLTLNRPQRLNAMSDALIEAMNHELARARDDADIRAVLLTGIGRGFCAGADLSGGSGAFDHTTGSKPLTIDTHRKVPAQTREANITPEVARGKRIWEDNNCMGCHTLFGEGAKIGPDLTGSQRAVLDYVLENVLDPSAVVPREYQMITFVLADDRVVGGIVLRETKDAVTGDEAVFLETLEGGIERPLVHFQHPVRDLLHALADPPPVHRCDGEGLEDE